MTELEMSPIKYLINSKQESGENILKTLTITESPLCSINDQIPTQKK
jgi:hypothetical protein